MIRWAIRLALVVIGAVLVNTVARAQCTAFLAPPDAEVRDTSTKPLPKGSGYSILLPAVTAFSSTRLCFHDGISLEIAECFPEKGKKKSTGGWSVFYRLKGTSDDCDTVLAKPDSLVPFNYDLPVSLNGHHCEGEQNRSAIAHAALLMLDKLRGANFKPPEVVNQATFAAPLDRVWSALVEVIAEQKWQIESIDKASGLITTKPRADADRSTMVCATRMNEGHRLSLNIFAKAVSDGTRVKVNATFEAHREDAGAITCYSNGAVEASIFSGITTALTAQ